MGQAKKRGTYEQRKAAAIKQGRNKEEEIFSRSKIEHNKFITGAALQAASIALMGLPTKKK